MALEHLGRIAPVSGSLIVAVSDGREDLAEDELHDQIRLLIKRWDPIHAAETTLAGVPAVVFALRGFNHIAGVYRRDDAVLVIDPDGPFWRAGGGVPDPVSGHSMHASFLDAISGSLPAERTLLGRLEITSGMLVIAEAWQATLDEQRIAVRVDPGRYVIERLRMACPWDAAVDARHGLQVAMISPTSWAGPHRS